MGEYSLTREDAATRAALLSVRAYDLAFDLTDGRGGAGEGTFRTRTTIAFGCATPGASTFVDLIPATIHAVRLNDAEVDPARWDGARLPLTGLAADNVLVVDAAYRYSTSGEGLHRFVDPVDGAVYLYAMTCIAEGRRMYACFDQPDLKGTFTVEVTAPPGWLVVGNGAVASTGPAAGGALTTHLATTAPISTYITTVVAGPYHRVTGTWPGPEGDVELGVSCRASLAPYLDVDEILEVTAAGFDLYRREFDHPYPFGKYDQVFAPEFNAGAMENAGAVVLRDQFVFRSRVGETERTARAYVILHELAHMWFGNLVTTRWWGDIWLNESFATYVAYLAAAEATRWTTAWTDFAVLERADAYRQDQFPTTHPIVADIPDVAAAEVNFDGITYAKGASVLKQLVAYVGREPFFAALRGYFREHAFGNATLADLLAALERASGRDLTAWSAEWLEAAQVNTLRAERTVGPDGRLAAVTVHQGAVAAHPTLRSHRVVVGCYDDVDGRLVRTGGAAVDVTGEHTAVADLAGRQEPALLLVNDEDLTYAKVRFDEASLRTLLDRVADVADPLARGVCWAGLWDMTRDGELAASTFLDLAGTGAGRETAPALRTALIDHAGETLRRLLPPERVPAAAQRWADVAADALDAAVPGGDAQLAWFRVLADVGGATTHAGRLGALHRGEAAVAGLTLDLDARWRLVYGLVPYGLAGDLEIAAELAREPSAAAEQHAATARALRPGAEAKARAWRSITTDDTLPAVVRRAAAAGFWHPAQAAELAPYVETYVAELDGFWSRYGGGVIARDLTDRLFPALVTPAAVAAVARWLDRDDRPAAQRRLVLERHDEAARALRAQEHDRATG